MSAVTASRGEVSPSMMRHTVLVIGAETCSSAFVDEVIGKLLEKYGFSAFVQMISIANVHGVVALLLNHSVRQRLVGEQTLIQKGE
jgi:hypothetical protein